MLGEMNELSDETLIISTVIALCAYFTLEDEEDAAAAMEQEIAPTIPRQRRLASDIFEQLGPCYTRRAFRMTAPNFYDLHRYLYPYLRRIYADSPKSHKDGARNGLVPSTSRVAVALRYFAGGSPYDLSVMFGMSVREIYRSVWAVVDAINRCDKLRIVFPANHDDQRQLAQGFAERSSAQFDCCVGAIDGLLIWTEKPSKKDCKIARCGPLKFMCGRKRKYGLNMMGTVDYKGRFLDVEIRHPGSTSDYLAFALSNLKAKLDLPGFLAPGLVLFGDNAYGNSQSMVTPYKGSKLGTTQDSFNFYHSQMRIQVECAFGKLVHRWGILRRPISKSIGIKKTCNMVVALSRLHNFCTDRNCPNDVPLEADTAFAAVNSGIELNETAANNFEPAGLLHGGEHLEDVGRNILRQHQRSVRRHLRADASTPILPQQRLHDLVVNKALLRPTPRQW